VSDLVPTPPNTTRASDADRDRVLQVLATATADGRLTVDEHDELTTRALHARTMGELQVLTQDLAHHEAPVPAPSPIVPTGAASKRGLLTIFGARSRKGAWHVPTEMRATAIFGAIELDFRDAQFEAAEVVCHASCLFGAVEITVPDWVRVVDDGSAIFGAREEAGAGAGEPRVTLHLRGWSIFGATEVRRKAPKQSRGDRELRGDAPNGGTPRALEGGTGELPEAPAG
jgi:hypothetical protein